MEQEKLHKMAYDAYMNQTIFFTEHQKPYIQGFKDGYNSHPLEAEVKVSFADIKKDFEKRFFTEMEFPHNSDKIPVLFTAERRATLWKWIEEKLSKISA